MCIFTYFNRNIGKEDLVLTRERDGGREVKGGRVRGKETDKRRVEEGEVKRRVYRE